MLGFCPGRAGRKVQNSPMSLRPPGLRPRACESASLVAATAKTLDLSMLRMSMRRSMAAMSKSGTMAARTAPSSTFTSRKNFQKILLPRQGDQRPRPPATPCRCPLSPSSSVRSPVGGHPRNRALLLSHNACVVAAERKIVLEHGAGIIRASARVRDVIEGAAVSALRKMRRARESPL